MSFRQRKIDSSKESLVVVTGVEAQALFNWLINCRSTVSNTGPHAGIPPTLLAPVAFTGATLTPFKVRITFMYHVYGYRQFVVYCRNV